MAARKPAKKPARGGGGRRPRQPLPQPPAQAQPTGGGQSGYYDYQQPVSQQLQQPYQDALMQGGVGALPSIYRNFGQQNQMGNIYGQQAAGTIGNYGQLMGGNQDIQQRLAQQIQAIQSGADKGYDPLLDQQLGQQEQVLRNQLRQNLGGDYETSSAGSEALQRFRQSANTQQGSSRFNQLQGLMNQQQQGLGNLANQGQGFGNLFGNQAQQTYNQGMGFGQSGINAGTAALNNLGQMQNLYNSVPQNMAQYGQLLGQQSQYGVNAQRPYQQDRTTEFTNYYPNNGMMWGQMMGQSGDRTIRAAGAMGGGMGGGGG